MIIKSFYTSFAMVSLPSSRSNSHLLTSETQSGRTMPTSSATATRAVARSRLTIPGLFSRTSLTYPDGPFQDGYTYEARRVAGRLQLAAPLCKEQLL